MNEIFADVSLLLKDKGGSNFRTLNIRDVYTIFDMVENYYFVGCLM